MTRCSTKHLKYKTDHLSLNRVPTSCIIQLLPNLYHLGSASREEVSCSSVGPIQEKLESMAGEVTTVLDQQLKVKKN